jgi:hypothetical protein
MNTLHVKVTCNGTTPAWRAIRGGLAQGSMGRFFGFPPLIFFCALLIWPFGGGGKKVQMMAGRQTPGARGVVTVQQGDNGNRELDVKVQSLALPSSLTPPASAYVVWIQEPGQQPENLGQIQLDSHENGELHVKTPFARFKVFITAEENAQVHVPQGIQVLSADITASSS